ncbi:MAG: tetratricopeptide repeat protein [Microcoleaceae cyanobacterium]
MSQGVKAIQNQSIFAQRYYKQASQLQQQGEYQKAVELYTKILGVSPENAEVYCSIGDCYFESQQWLDALQIYQATVRLQPCSQVFYRLGHVHINLQQWQQAIEIFQKVTQLEPNFHQAYYSLGYVFIQVGQLNDAAEAYRTAARLNPQDCWYFYELANTLSRQSLWHEAITNYQQAIQLNPNQDWFYQNLGDVFQNINQFDQAEIVYKKAIKIQPHSWYYLSLSRSLIQQKKYQEAINYLIYLFHIKPDEYGTFSHLGEILSAYGDDEASLDCQTLIQLPEYWIKKYFKLPNDYRISISSISSDFYKIIYPETYSVLSNARGFRELHHPAFSQRRAYHESTLVIELQDCRIWAENLNIAVLNSNSQIVDQLSMGCPEVVLSSNALPESTQLKGTVAFLSVQFGVVFYHWMLDVLPRIHLIQAAGYDLNQIDWFVVNQYQYPYEQESLQLLKLPPERILTSRQVPHIQAPRMIVPAYQSEYCFKPPPWVVTFLRNTFLSGQQSSFGTSETPVNHRIYISRHNATCRRLVNEAEVTDYLAQHGFQTVQLENLSLRQQAVIMSQAEVVIATHGSGLTNILFCSSGAKIVEILSPAWINPCYWHLSSICQLDYFYLFGEPSTDAHTAQNRQDFWVNLRDLQEFLKQVGVL